MMRMKDGATKLALDHLREYRHVMTFQEYNTIKGQIIAGEISAAMKGLETVIKRLEALKK